MWRIWELDENGFYLRPTGRIVQDYFNGMHFSTSDWTQGCLRIAKEEDARWIWQYVPVGTKFEVVE